MAFIHIAHVVSLVALIAAFGMGAGSLGLSYVHIAGWNSPSATPILNYNRELLPFKTCTDINGRVAAYTSSKCQSWQDYWSVNTAYCPTIGTTGNATTKDLLDRFYTAGVSNGLYVFALFLHIVVAVLYAVRVIPTRFAVIPLAVICIIAWSVSMSGFGRAYYACDQNFCDAAPAALTKATYLASTECYFADGFRCSVASFVIFIITLVPLLVVSPPEPEVVKTAEEVKSAPDEAEDKKPSDANVLTVAP